MPNKYVDFVSDEHFLKCVKRVCEAYSCKSILDKNGLDIIKAMFDINNHKTTYEEWTLTEKLRQTDKTVNNKIGEFHQMLLSQAKGWSELPIGHILRVDLKNDDNTIFIELKNKHNTITFGKLRNVFDVLKEVADRFPNALVYYAYIIPKTPGSGEAVWRTSQRIPHPRVKVAWGKRVYEIVTGDKNALEKTWNALPQAIAEVLGKQDSIDSVDKKKLLELFQSAF